MKNLLQDRVIILRKIVFKESDLILHAINTRGSKVHFLARGAVKSKKRFAGGVLEPSHYLQISYQQSRSSSDSQLHTLLEASILEGFVGLRTNYDRLQSALHLLKLTDRISFEDLPENRKIFDLLGNSLRAAEKVQDVQMLKTQFEIKLLYNQGVLPPHDSFMPFVNTPVSECDKLSNFPSEDLKFVRLQVQQMLSSLLEGRTPEEQSPDLEFF